MLPNKRAILLIVLSSISAGIAQAARMLSGNPNSLAAHILAIAGPMLATVMGLLQSPMQPATVGERVDAALTEADKALK